MHSWKRIVELLEAVGRPQTVGMQTDMAHTLLFLLGANAPEDRLLPADYDWSDPAVLDDALRTMTHALRPWTIDFHIAQNDATVKTPARERDGRHCLPLDPNGKLDIVNTPASGCATTRVPSRAPSSTCAGTAACSRMRS
jgi:hypothetical protein